MDQIAAFFAALFSGFWGPLLNAALIVVIAIVVRWVAQRVIKHLVNRIVNGAKKRSGVDDTQALAASPLAAARIVQRTRALGGVLSSVVTTVVIIIAGLLVIDRLWPNTSGAFALITAALGAGLGFGAQNIVKDVLNGLFMVGEDQLGVGDVVDTGSATGIVEAVGIRVTQLRDVNGTVWHVRNGEITRIGNLSQGWSRAIIDLQVPYDVDLDQVQERLLATAVGMWQESRWKRVILERPEIWGIEAISGDGIVLRLVVKTRSASKDEVARELRARLKRTLDELEVRLPGANSIVLSGFESATPKPRTRAPKGGSDG